MYAMFAVPVAAFLIILAISLSEIFDFRSRPLNPLVGSYGRLVFRGAVVGITAGLTANLLARLF